MAKEFLNDLNIHGAGQIQFKTTAGSNAGKIDQSGNDLVLSNAVGDIIIGNGSDDVFIGDGTNTVDIRFEQNMAIFADSSSTRTLTLGGANTSLVLESPTINGTVALTAATMSNNLIFTTANGHIVFDHEPSGDTGEYTTEVALLKIDKGGTEKTILSRVSENGALALGIDDTVAITAGDTKSVIKANHSFTNENVVFASEGGFIAYGFPNNDTSWTNRNEFQFRSESTTASSNGLYIGDGGRTQFIDLSRNLLNIGTISSGAITSSGKLTINTGSDDILTLNQTSTDTKWNYINFKNQGTREWFIGQDSDGNFDLYNDNIDAYAITVNLSNNSILLNDTVTVAQALTITTGDVTLSNGNVIVGSQYGIRFNDANTRIYTNTDSPEDLIIEADQDLLLTPDGQVSITGNLDVSGTVDGAGGTMTGDLIIDKSGDNISNIQLRRDTTADNTIVGDISWLNSNAQGSDDRLAIIRAATQGGNTSNRGGQLSFFTRVGSDSSFRQTVVNQFGDWSFHRHLTVSTGFGAGTVKLPVGSSSAPSLTFINNTDSGIYTTDGTSVTTTIDGTKRLNVTNGGIDVAGNIIVSGTVDGVDIAALATANTGDQDLSSLATLASPTFTGVPAAPTASAGTNTTQLATTAFVSTAVSNLVDSAPGTLNTLNELAAALGDDQNFSTTVTNSIDGKVAKAGDTMTGDLVINSDGLSGLASTVASNPKTELRGFIAVPGPETSRNFVLPGITENKFAGAHVRSGYSISVTKDGSTISPSLDNAFLANDNFSGIGSLTSSTVIVITVGFPGCSHGSNFGITFSNTAWRAKDVKIERSTDDGANYVTIYDITDSGRSAHIQYSTTGSTATNKVRYTLTNFVTSSVRISQIIGNNYVGGDGYFLQLYKGNTVYGNINPGTNNAYDLGTSSVKWRNILGINLHGDLVGTINTATTAATQSASDNSTKVATTAFVTTAVGNVTLSSLGAQASGNYITGSGSLSSQNLTDIGNLSGTNTGDQDLSGFVTKASAQTISGAKTFTSTTKFKSVNNQISIIDSDDDQDFRVQVNGGIFSVRDHTNSQTIFKIDANIGDNALKLESSGATFAGDIVMANSKILYSDDIRASSGGMIIGPTGESDLVFRTHAQTALTIDGSTRAATFAGAITTTSTSTGAITLNGGTGVATTGAFILRQNGDGDGNGMAITSSNATSHRIWKDSSGNFYIGSSANSNAFKQDTSGNVTIEGDVTIDGGDLTVDNVITKTSGGSFRIKNSGGTTIATFANGGTANVTGNFGVGGSPSVRLDVNAGTTNTVALFESTDDKAFIKIKDNDTDTHLISKDGHFSIGDSSSDYDNFKINITNGNVTVAGTVDGRDIAADGTKLDGIAAGATANTGTVTSVTAGNGMTQSGTSTVNPTLNVVGGDGINANANDIAIDYSSGNDNVITSAQNGTPSSNATILFNDSGGVNKVALSSIDVTHFDSTVTHFITFGIQVNPFADQPGNNFKLLPLSTSGEGTSNFSSPQAQHYFIPAYDGKIKSLIIRNVKDTPTSGPTRIRVYKNGATSSTSSYVTPTGGSSVGMYARWTFSDTFSQYDRVQMAFESSSSTTDFKACVAVLEVQYDDYTY